MSNFKHGGCAKGGTTAFRSWQYLKQMKSNPKVHWYNPSIEITYDWNTYEGFKEDMGTPPLGWKLHVKDRTQEYNIFNCYWGKDFKSIKKKHSNHLNKGTSNESTTSKDSGEI